MIIKDVDGDLWEENSYGFFDCRTQVFASKSRETLKEDFGPVEVFETPKSADLSVYRVVYTDGSVKYASRRSLAGIIVSRGWSYRIIETIERAANVDWSDVTDEFSIKRGLIG